VAKVTLVLISCMLAASCASHAPMTQPVVAQAAPAPPANTAPARSRPHVVAFDMVRLIIMVFGTITALVPNAAPVRVTAATPVGEPAQVGAGD